MRSGARQGGGSHLKEERFSFNDGRKISLYEELDHSLGKEMLNLLKRGRRPTSKGRNPRQKGTEKRISVKNEWKRAE